MSSTGAFKQIPITTEEKDGGDEPRPPAPRLLPREGKIASGRCEKKDQFSIQEITGPVRANHRLRFLSETLGDEERRSSGCVFAF